MGKQGQNADQGGGAQSIILRMYVDRHIKYQTRVMPIPFRNQKLKRQYQTTKITKYKRFYFK